MKKFFPLATCLLLFLMACQEKESSISNRIEDADKFIATFNQNKLPQDQGHLLEGSVALRTSEQGMLVAFIESPAIDHTLAYTLQQVNGDLFEDNIEQAQVLFLRKKLIINALDDERLYELKIDAAPAKIVEGMTITKTFTGYGLGIHKGFEQPFRRTNQRNNDPGGTIAFEVSCQCEDEISDDPLPDCDAGGVGSSSCSISSGSGAIQESCSVECKADYFACCPTTE